MYEQVQSKINTYPKLEYFKKPFCYNSNFAMQRQILLINILKIVSYERLFYSQCAYEKDDK